MSPCRKNTIAAYLTLACLFLYLTGSTPAAETTISLPLERIILNLTPAPHNSQAVTWRSLEKSVNPKAQLVRISQIMNPEHPPKTYPAVSSDVEIDNERVVYHHSVVLDGLEPETTYAYRVGNNHHFSEWNQFTTAAENHKPFTFLYFGDVQQHIKSMCSQLFRAALQEIPESRFWLFAGDMVNNGPNDADWEEFFSALGWIPRTVPMVFLPGNHEYPDRRFISADQYQITPLWQPHFTLPGNGPLGLEETVFSFQYQGVKFIILNGNEQIEKQAEWLEKTLLINRQPWTIVAIHQPVYSISKRKHKTNRLRTFAPVFDRFSVDIVLQGHDHGYARTFPLKNNKPAQAGEKGTVYVISNAGPKMYPITSLHDHLMAKISTGRMLFQSIRLDGNTLEFAAYNMMKEKIDAFSIHKAATVD